MIKRIVIDPDAFSEAVERAYETDTEVGFYLIGFIRNNTAYVYDIIEFQYSEKTTVSVGAIPGQASRISVHLPIGLKVIGAMHKHPDYFGPKYSAIDEETFLNWYNTDKECVFIIFSHKGKNIKGYTVENGEIKEIDVIIEHPPGISFISVLLGEISITAFEGLRPYDIIRSLEKEIEKSVKIPSRIGKIDILEEGVRIPFLQEIKLPHKLRSSEKVFIRILYGKYMIPFEFVMNANETVSDLKEYLSNLLGFKDDFILLFDGRELKEWMPLSVLNNKTIVLMKRKPVEALQKNFTEYYHCMNEIMRALEDLLKVRQDFAKIPLRHRIQLSKNFDHSLLILMKNFEKLTKALRNIAKTIGLQYQLPTITKVPKTKKKIREIISEKFWEIIKKILPI